MPHLFSDAEEEAISLLSCLFTASLTCEVPTDRHARRPQPTAPATAVGAAAAAGGAVVTGAVFVRPPGTAQLPADTRRSRRASDRSMDGDTDAVCLCVSVCVCLGSQAYR